MSIDMVKLSLTFGEQAQLVAILNGFKGTMNDLAFVLDDMKVVKITAEEFALVNAVDHTDPRTGQKNGIKSWDDEKAESLGEKEFEISQIAVDFVKADIDDRSKKGQLTIRDSVAIALRKKLL